jgi:hypothetical protein
MTEKSQDEVRSSPNSGITTILTLSQFEDSEIFEQVDSIDTNPLIEDNQEKKQSDDEIIKEAYRATIKEILMDMPPYDYFLNMIKKVAQNSTSLSQEEKIFALEKLVKNWHKLDFCMESVEEVLRNPDIADKDKFQKIKAIASEYLSNDYYPMGIHGLLKQLPIYDHVKLIVFQSTTRNLYEHNNFIDDAIQKTFTGKCLVKALFETILKAKEKEGEIYKTLISILVSYVHRIKKSIAFDEHKRREKNFTSYDYLTQSNRYHGYEEESRDFSEILFDDHEKSALDQMLSDEESEIIAEAILAAMDK